MLKAVDGSTTFLVRYSIMLDEYKKPAQTPKKAPEGVTEEHKLVHRDKEIIKPKIHSFQPPQKEAKNRLRRWFAKLSKKQWLVFIFAGAFLVVAIGVGAYTLYPKKKPIAKPIANKQTIPIVTTEPATLTGLTVPMATNKLPVTGVMIENSPDARPQSGLNDAGVVFEAVAEGGITRFLTLFQSNNLPTYLGPVRSVRPYYLDYLQGFDAAVAHVGGSPEAMAQIRNEGIKDLDQFANGGSYDRVNSRYAPHNVYTSMARLLALQNSKGFTSSYTGFIRKAEQANPTPTAKTIDFVISSYLYDVHYDYAPATNSYLRSEGGKPHIDERSKSQLNPKVVIAIVVPKSIASDGVHSAYQDIGTGKAYIFQDGTMTECIWTKPDKKTQITFTDSAGAPQKLNPGQTWITLVGLASDVTSKP